MSIETSNGSRRTPDYGNPKTLAVSLKMSASYLEHCAEKHNATGADLRRYEEGQRKCEFIASALGLLKDNNPALVRYRNELYSLDAAQIEAFARIIIDYQARIGSDFNPISVGHYLADLTAIIFTLSAIEDPACLLGVGTGFAPRYNRRDVPARHTGNVVSLRAEREPV